MNHHASYRGISVAGMSSDAASIAVSSTTASNAMGLTLKMINDELRRLGHDVHIEKGDGYFYFWKGDANKWLDRTVNVPNVSSLTLQQWIDEFERLKKLNGKMLPGKVPKKAPKTPKSTSTQPRTFRT